MSSQCRKIARRRDRLIFTPRPKVKRKTGEPAPKPQSAYTVQPMNKQQRIIGGLVAEQHIKDRRFAQVRGVMRGNRILSISAKRKKHHHRGKKRRAV